MFKKRAVQVSLVDKPKGAKNDNPDDGKKLQPETVAAIADRAKEVVKHVSIAVVGVYAAFKTIDTLSQIAIKKTKSADQE